MNYSWCPHAHPSPGCCPAAVHNTKGNPPTKNKPKAITKGQHLATLIGGSETTPPVGTKAPR